MRVQPQVIIFGFIGVVVVLAILVITGILPGLKTQPPPPFSLEIWGTDENADIWESITDEYTRNAVVSAKITYVAKDPATYEDELVNALASGKGPDIFFLKDSLVRKDSDKILTLAEGQLGYRARDLRITFADGIAAGITDKTGNLLGVPLAFDTLALFYNRDYFNSANIPSPPKTWAELTDDAKRLAKFSDIGSIQRSGVALGVASNVDHAADIMLALILQKGGGIVDQAGTRSAIASQATEDAISFYTSFGRTAQKTYSWDTFFDRSITAFAKGDTAMALGYADDVKKIAVVNPQLNFDVAPLPQDENALQAVNIGRFTMLSVSRTSAHPNDAWNFLLWLESQKVEKVYIDAVGLPPARRDLVGSTPPRDYLTPFYGQALSAKTIPVALGDSLETILDDMIDGIVTGRFQTGDAIGRADSQIGDLLRAQ